MRDNNKSTQSLLHKQAIHELLLRFCRGIDRCDLALLKTVFREDCIVDYGKIGGAAWEFFTSVLAAKQQSDVTHHQMSNVLIDLDGDSAQAESYVTVYHFVNEAGTDMDMTVGGRYLDTFAQRDNEWQIIKRIFVIDWNQNVPSSARWEEGLHAKFTHRGAHYPDDILYRQLKTASPEE